MHYSLIKPQSFYWYEPTATQNYGRDDWSGGKSRYMGYTWKYNNLYFVFLMLFDVKLLMLTLSPSLVYNLKCISIDINIVCYSIGKSYRQIVWGSMYKSYIRSIILLYI